MLRLLIFLVGMLSTRRPGPMPPRTAGGYRPVNILPLAIRHSRQHRAVGWVEARKGFPRNGGGPFAADEVVLRPLQPGADLAAGPMAIVRRRVAIAANGGAMLFEGTDRSPVT